ncbi:MAG TPA: nuclease-related domain-containing protein [Acidimicrobiales bacterium]|nr:nuclease-related domain-containing protein [Acidimicrobiales bacterium]
MGKGLASRANAGASAAAEYRRARGAARQRKLVNAAGAALAAGLLMAGVWTAQPWLGVAGVGVGLADWLLRPESDPDRWRRGAAGEVATAALLSRLPRRFVVLHDRRLPGVRANVDHLVIGPTGVWVVDSKAYRARLRIRRGQVWAGGYHVPTTQAAWEAERVEHLLGMSVQALVAVHADGLRRRGKVVGGVRVLPATRLGRRLRRGRRVLTRAEIADLGVRADTLLPPAR